MLILKTSRRAALGRRLDLPGENKTNIKADVCSMPAAGLGGSPGLFFLNPDRLHHCEEQKYQLEKESEGPAAAFHVSTRVCVQPTAPSLYPLPPRRPAAREHRVIRPSRWAVTGPTLTRVSSLCHLSGRTSTGRIPMCLFTLPPRGFFRSQRLGAFSRFIHLVKTDMLRGQQEDTQREDADTACCSGQRGSHGHPRPRDVGACELVR